MCLYVCTTILIFSILLIIVGGSINNVETGGEMLGSGLVIAFLVLFLGFGAYCNCVTQKKIESLITPYEIIKAKNVVFIRYINDDNEIRLLESDKVSVYNANTNEIFIIKTEYFNVYGKNCGTSYKLNDNNKIEK